MGPRHPAPISCSQQEVSEGSSYLALARVNLHHYHNTISIGLIDAHACSSSTGGVLNPTPEPPTQLQSHCSTAGHQHGMQWKATVEVP